MSNSLFEFHLKFRSNYYNVNIIIELHFEKNKNKIKQKQTNKQTLVCTCYMDICVNVFIKSLFTFIKHMLIANQGVA